MSTLQVYPSSTGTDIWDYEKCADKAKVGSLHWPKRYREVETHYNQKLIAGLSLASTTSMAKLHASDDATWKITLESLTELQRLKFPVRWVGADLSKDLTKTDPPENLVLEELKFPYPVIQFLFDRHWARSYFGCDVPIFMVGRLPFYLKDVKEDRECFCVSAFCFDIETRKELGTYSVFMPVRETQISKLFDADFKTYSFSRADPDDRTIINRISAIAVHLIMYMTTVDKEASGGVITPAIVKGSGPTKEIVKPALWAPRWLGEHYKSYYNPQGGTHASPVFHFRSAHWRHQRVGPGRKEVKLTWIKLTAVNKPI